METTDSGSPPSRGRSTMQYEDDEKRMIGHMRERLAVVETTVGQLVEMARAQRQRMESQTTRFEALEGRVNRNESMIYHHTHSIAAVPPLAERVSTMEHRSQTSEQLKAERDHAKQVQKEQRQDALKALSLFLAGLTLVGWLLGKIPAEAARPILSALGIGK